MEIGERIKKRREELGMSQEELAQKAGYKSRSSINKIEIDGRGLPQSKIVNIANALDTTPAYIMGWEENYYLGENLQRIFRILSKEFEISENELIRCFFAEDFDALLPSKKFITLDNMRCALKEYLANHVLDKNISLNSKENNHLKKYRALDMHGQELIDTILDKEYERCIATKNNTVSELGSLRDPYLLPQTAHERTDIEVTDDIRKRDDITREDKSCCTIVSSPHFKTVGEAQKFLRSREHLAAWKTDGLSDEDIITMANSILSNGD